MERTMTMKEISKVKDQVERMLIENPATRNSDLELYVALCMEINPEACKRPFAEVMLHRKEYGLPNTETVRRSRQVLQEHNIALRGSKKATDGRFDNYKSVREFVLNEKV